jgi:DNA polymerase epsilon subunit 1
VQDEENNIKDFSYNNPEDVTKANEASYRVSRENDTIDSKYGFDRVKDITERTGYLINMHSVSYQHFSYELKLNINIYFIL